MRKRIGIDLHVFDGKYQGSRTHIVEIMSRVVKTAKDIDFFIFLENIEALQAQWPEFNAENVFLIPMASTNSINRLCYVLPKFQKEKSLDLFHTQYISPLPSLSPCVVTIHDILFETHPQYFTRFFRLRSKLLIRLSAMSSRHIFTVSEFCKKELISRYHVDPSKITVIHNGVDHTRFCPGEEGKELVEKRGLKIDEYILSVGRLEPRKNYDTLLRAYYSLGYDAPPLVIVGQPDFKYENIFELVRKLKIENRVIIVDDANDIELPAIYRHAKLFVYPSYAEGFGIPPLEAMASGVPVLCSNSTAIPEVVGAAASLFEPSNAKQISDLIREMLMNKALRLSKAQAGLTQSRLYTWDKAAEITLSGYRRALS